MSRRLFLPAVATAAVLLLAACSGGGGGGGGTTSSGAKAPTVNEGVLMIGSQQSYIPGEFRAEGSQDLQGFGVEIVEEVAERLGLTTQWVQVDYSAIITGLQAGQFDMGSGGMSPNPERLQQVDMIGYYQSGATFLVRKADAGKYATGQALCGQKLGMLEGSTTLEKAVEKENASCPAGKIGVEHYTSTPLGLQGLLSERIAAYAPDLAQAQYIVKENPDQFATTDYHLVDYLINFTFMKDRNPELRDAVYTTLDAMMKDGTYGRILAKWNLAVGGLKQPAYNGQLDAKP
ncbi:polar amino acid transport system substrate-binding protein [Nonomuraea thailandensis]|uniref:Polar amino acid transport system substrate-binding protein n=1 Tax=Nonomuraea thailandensis TaxID=1188745 RepID=A0A9X2K7I4_9ACTN|nr:transporter substrate-binding domain-containing protein [Nonomuraea thailandensis]MCP2363682.1 polar amino acid transport system substrate-binding protein [Nonomuraea thailandensis]